MGESITDALGSGEEIAQKIGRLDQREMMDHAMDIALLLEGKSNISSLDISLGRTDTTSAMDLIGLLKFQQLDEMMNDTLQVDSATTGRANIMSDIYDGLKNKATQILSGTHTTYEKTSELVEVKSTGENEKLYSLSQYDADVISMAAAAIKSERLAQWKAA